MSNDGQDDWVRAQFPEGFKGWAVELGANDGESLSNSLSLEREGWEVLCIEPMRAYADKARKIRKRVLTCACDDVPKDEVTLYTSGTLSTLSTLDSGNSYVGESERTTVLTLNQCLMVAGFPRLDALFLDVDGIELRILKGLNLEKWRPKVAVVEDYYGPGGVREFMEQQGYEHVGDAGFDWLYLRRD